MTYTATAKRWAHGWELHIDDVGVTQARSLSMARKAAREYIAALYDIDDESSIDVEITPELPQELADQAAAVKEANRRAEETRDEAARKARQTIQHMLDAGLTKSDAAEVLDVSPQRISQLAHG